MIPYEDLSLQFEVGDWVRLGHNNTGPVFTITDMATVSPYTLTLSSVYFGPTSNSTMFYEHGVDMRGQRNGYQYVVEFDSNLGDLAALIVDGSNLKPNNLSTTAAANHNATASIVSCDWYVEQKIRTSAAAQIGGSFYIRFKGDRTMDLAWDIGAAQMKAALETLDSVHAATVREINGPYVNGGYKWTVRLDSIEGDHEPLYTEGHLLTGQSAGVAVDNLCGYSPGHVGSKVTSVAGRLGHPFLARLSGPAAVQANISHVEQGLYGVSYETPRVGTYSLEVAGATVGGLSAEYFNKRWLYGDASMTRVDPVVDFSWTADDIITPTGKDYISGRWTGFVQPTFGEVFTFYVTANDGARLFVNGEPLFDSFENEVSEEEDAVVYQGITSVALVADMLTNVVLEWRENTGAASVRLAWSSASQPKTVIPSNRLFSSSTPIVYSPFAVEPTGIKATPPTGASLEIAKWDEVLTSWYAPTNDGGEAITAYRVTWWSAVLGDYGDNEVQTIRFSDLVDGGTWLLTSPGGYKYPKPLDWDIEYDALETVLESLYDVSDVEVSLKANKAEGSRDYVVTFLSNLGDVDPLSVDHTALRASGNGERAVLVCAKNDLPTWRDISCRYNDSVVGNATVITGGLSTDVSLDVAEGAPYTYTIEQVDQNSVVEEGFGVRVDAYNTLGFSVPCETMYLKPMAIPDPPEFVQLVRVAGSSTALNVYWTYTYYPRNRASKVRSYLIEWNGAADFSSAVGGSYENTLSTFPCDRLDHSSFGEYFLYTIEDLAAGTPYYVRVSAINDMGTGSPEKSDPEILTPSKTADQLEYGVGVTLATIPADDAITVLESSESLLVSWQPPVSDHGDDLSQYLLEYWHTPGRDEVEVIQTSASTQANISGTFTVEYDGDRTDTLPYDVTEDAMEDALEELTTLRDVRVVRSNYSSGYGYEWTVTFLSEVPYSRGKTLTVNGADLMTPVGTASVLVGADLATGAPGHKKSTTVSVWYGSNRILVTNYAGIDIYDYVKLSDGKVFQITDIDIASGNMTIDSKYYGVTAQDVGADFGVSVSGTTALGFTRHTISEAGEPVYGYVLTDLTPGQEYYIRVSAQNGLGYSQPQISLPSGLKAPRQKPDVPTNVQLVVNSGTSLKLLWNFPESSGGETITKYKVEWDTRSTFDSTNGAPLGSHHKILTDPDTECRSVPCSYVISSLSKGTSYYTRVYAYNSYGYSVAAGIPVNLFEAPKRQPVPPSLVTVAPASETSLLVTFPASHDDGGGEVSSYKVEWDTVGQEGAASGALSYNESMLYSPYSVQTVETSSDTSSLYGSFRLAFNGLVSETLPYDISAYDMRQALEVIPSVGAVSVSRSQKSMTADGSYGYVWTVTFLTLEGQHDFLGDTDVLTVSINRTDYAFGFSSAVTETGGSWSSTDVTLMCTTCNSLSVEVTETVERYDGFAQQIITTYSAGDNSTIGGTFKVKRDGLSTVDLDADVSALVMERALETLANVGDLHVTRKAVTNGYSWIVVFLDQLGNQPPFTLDGGLLTCSELGEDFGVELNAEYNAGILPIMDSGNTGSMELSGDDISTESISYEIPDLIRGASYHVRVSAWNGVGNTYGKTMYSTPALQYPSAEPEAPGTVSVAATSGAQLNVSWSPPLNNNGRTVTKYKIEWDGSPGTSEVQQVHLSATSAVDGTFRLSFRGQSTGALPYDATEERVQLALEALQTVGRVQVARTGPVSNGYMWEVTFLQNTGDLPLLTVDKSGLVGKKTLAVVTEVVAGTDPGFDQGTVGIHQLPLGYEEVVAPGEVQTVSVKAKAEDIYGYYYLEFMGETTEAIRHWATANEFKAALEGLSTITAVTVTKTATAQSSVAPLSDYGWEYEVTFTDQAGDLPSILAYTGDKTRTLAAGGTLEGTSAYVEVVETIKGALPTHLVTPPTLAAGSTYFVRVSAFNSLGWSEPSIAQLSAVTENQAPGAPLGVEVSVYSNTELQVSWQTPAANGGDEVSKFLVEWDYDTSFDDSAGTNMVEAVQGQDAYNFTISELTSGQKYMVRVTAYNPQGYGQAAVAIPVGEFETVQEILISGGYANRATILAASYKLTVTDLLNEETTKSIAVGALASDVQAALQDLDNTGMLFRSISTSMLQY